ncbi:MAG: GNAT family N-acetyltransferase [Candidatus Micrarchaeota archaeon]
MIIEEARKEHVEALFELTNDFFPYIEPTLETILDRLESENIFYLVALIKKEVVGFVDVEFCNACFFKELHELKKGECSCDGLQAKILGLAVKKEFQGEGIGTKLLKAALFLAKKQRAGSVVILVTVDNKKAQKLYEEIGFKQKGVLERRIGGKEILFYFKKN